MPSFNFNPPSPCGEGPSALYPLAQMPEFQSTLPVWGGTLSCTWTPPVWPYFNPPSPCGEGRRAGRTIASICNFNPPSPCGEGHGESGPAHSGAVFQSTLPVWGGTGRVDAAGDLGVDFNPPSPCGEGPTQSTLLVQQFQISIHPPRVGRDKWAVKIWYDFSNFNPPSPCGEGLTRRRVRSTIWTFQSTLPVWGGTRGMTAWNKRFSLFQSTLPVWGGTRIRCDFSRGLIQFQSTLPVWGGTRNGGYLTALSVFQSTLPVWGGTFSVLKILDSRNISIHPPRVGRDFPRCRSSNRG